MNKYKTTDKEFNLALEIEEPEILKLKSEISKTISNRYDSLPHITLCLIPIPQNKIKEAFSRAKDIVRRYKGGIFIRLKDIKTNMSKAYPNEKFIFIDVKGKTLSKIHKDLIQALNPLRGNYIREKDHERIKEKKYGKEEIKHVLAHGSINALKNFKSHITLGSVDIAVSKSVIKKARELFKDKVKKEILLQRVFIGYDKGAQVQSEMKVLLRDRFLL